MLHSSYVALWLLLLFATTVYGANPYAPSQEGEVLVESIATKINELPSLSERLAAYGSAFDTYATQADFPILILLIKNAHISTRRDTTEESPLDKFHLWSSELPCDRLTVRQQSHLKFLFAKYKAFAEDVNSAESDLLDVLNLPKEDVHPFTITSTHYMAAYCSYYGNHLERSAYHARKAAEGFSRMGDQRRALEAYDGASTTFFKLGKIDSALYYARKGLALVENVADQYVSNLYLNYAEALMAESQADSAFYYARKADALIKPLNRPSSMARAQLCLANITSLSGQKREAIDYYKGSLKNFKLAREVYHYVDALDSLVNIHVLLNQYQEAYEASKQSFRIRDSLREDRLQKDADRIVAEYERDVLQKELNESEGQRAIAKAKLAKQRSERLSMIGVICSLLLLISLVYHRAVTRKRMTHELRAQVKERTAVLHQNSERLKAQAQSLKESNAELERFAYIASHDLKTPLRNVTSFLGLIRRRLPVESLALVRDYLDIALSNAHQMNDLVTDVLEFSRLNENDAIRKVSLKISTALDSVKSKMHAELEERNALISLEGDAELVLPKGVLEQILGELISNALKYNTSEVPLAQVFVTTMDERVRISIKDNGIGIDPEYHERIFEVFRRLHAVDEYTGTGVGLAACRKVIRQLEGAISVESKVAEGAIFHVDLPLHMEDQTGAPLHIASKFKVASVVEGLH